MQVFWGLSAGDIVGIWHAHRTTIILAALSLLIPLRLIAHYWASRQDQLYSSNIAGSPITEKVSTETVKIAIPHKASPAIKSTGAPVGRASNESTKAGPRRVTGNRKERSQNGETNGLPSTAIRIQPLIFYSSLGGTTEYFAKLLKKDLKTWQTQHTDQHIFEPQIHDLSYVELDDFFVIPPKSPNPSTRFVYLILLPTYNIDSVIDQFLESLKETHNDFRIDTAPLSSLAGYSVFGLGDREGWPTEEEGFCSQAKEADKWMAKLTAKKRAFPLGMGDTKNDIKQRLDEWREGVQDAMQELQRGKGLGDGVPGSGDAVESDEEDLSDGDDQVDADLANRTRVRKATKKAEAQDLEDLGSSIGRNKNSTPVAVDFTTYKVVRVEPTTVQTPKEMVPASSPTYAALTKQGYTIVGSHSGVKICRWTKSALRGRGSCYKYSFYGIQSHLCMETTPSLSCSNKCVFCWRHGTNPVGTTWRWKVDPPEVIFEGVKEGHYKKIKMLKGVPGVRAERFAEAMRIRHCALSLVGEPIFYPHINEFLAMLHAEHISSFLVCNAQHPDQLATLKHVTQLYVSIDASNKESLRKIDRPLHRDYWERFCRCLDILRERRFEQRTVFRLTLVKGFNIDDEVEGYADLVARGLPCFVEVKGVTFCGTSTSSSAGLTMANVPFYEEVAQFVTALNLALQRRNLNYGIAAEHAHSCCVLLASTRFKINDKWHTRIGYEKFFKCLEAGQPFGPEDYINDEPTPEWATWGRGGFDPRDQRVDRKGNAKEVTLIDYEGLENPIKIS